MWKACLLLPVGPLLVRTVCSSGQCEVVKGQEVKRACEGRMDGWGEKGGFIQFPNRVSDYQKPNDSLSKWVQQSWAVTQPYSLSVAQPALHSGRESDQSLVQPGFQLHFFRGVWFQNWYQWEYCYPSQLLDKLSLLSDSCSWSFRNLLDCFLLYFSGSSRDVIKGAPNFLDVKKKKIL